MSTLLLRGRQKRRPKFDPSEYWSLTLVHFLPSARMRLSVTVLGLCVCMCHHVRHHESGHYAQLSVQPKVRTYGFGAIWETCFVQKLWHTWQRQTLSRRPISTEASRTFLPQFCCSGYPSLFSVYFQMACNQS